MIRMRREVILLISRKDVPGLRCGWRNDSVACRHTVALERYGSRRYRVGGLEYLLKRSED